jgi:HEAT repeat protein
MHTAHALGNLRSEAAIPGLLKAIEDSDEYVRWSAADALGKLGSDAAIPELLKAIEHSNSGVRRRAAYALGNLGSEAAIPALLKAIEDSNSDVRSRAADALGNLGSEAAIPGLLKAIEHSNENLRIASIRAASHLPDNRLIAPLLSCIQYRGLATKEEVVQTFSQIGNSSNLSRLNQSLILQALSQTLESKHTSLRRRSRAAIIQIGNPHILTLLKQNVWCAPSTETLQAITQIQTNCKFYNYEIHQKALVRPPPANQQRPSGSPTYQFPNATEVKIFEQIGNYHECPRDPPS